MKLKKKYSRHFENKDFLEKKKLKAYTFDDKWLSQARKNCNLNNIIRKIFVKKTSPHDREKIII